MTDETVHNSEREIQEDVLNVPLIAWLGGITTILIIVGVILLIGVYYITQGQLDDKRQQAADARITDFEAMQLIDEMVVEGYYRHPDVDDGQGNVTRGTLSIPVEEGMKQVVQEANQ
ncbi:MAG: hypothetical protein AAF726_16555 [Planctomycetota bacterium]